MSQSSAQHTTKYRPLLTAAQISHIVTLCKQNLSDDSISVISILAPFEYKIRHDAVKAAYTVLHKISPLEAFSTEPAIPSRRISDKLAAFTSGDLSTLSTKDLEDVAEYRYLENLMSDIEKKDYEKKLFGF